MKSLLHQDTGLTTKKARDGYNKKKTSKSNINDFIVF
jgi:hypothetical protein